MADELAVLEEQLAQLKQTYQQSLPAKIKKIRDLWNCLRVGSIDIEKTNDLHTFVHKIAGSAGLFGYWELSGIAREIEQELMELINSKKRNSSKRILKIDALIIKISDIDLDLPYQQITKEQQT